MQDLIAAVQHNCDIADARYGYVHGVVMEVVDTSAMSRYTVTDRLDRVLTNRWLGLPIFFAVMFVVFKLVVDVSAYFLDWVDAVIGGPVTRWTTGLLGMASAPDWFVSLAVDGVIAGVGAVVIFLPQILILFFFLGLLEDTGYMARAAFVMDRFMRMLGLPGKSFVPLLVGFGCNVPAIMATRTLENQRDRTLTIMMNPFMSCGARLPVYALFAAAFWWIEIGIQDARAAGKLQLPGRWFRDVELRVAKQADKLPAGLAHDYIEASHRTEG